jgi:hypothetical protein
MAHFWENDLYKPLNMASIIGYLDIMPKEINKWLPKFSRNNVITAEQHLHVIGRDMQNEVLEHEDVAMKLLATSLTEDAQSWLDGLSDNHLTTY